MPSLSEDLSTYAHEAYTNKDIKAGLMLLAELAGLASLYATAAALSTISIPFIGPTFSRQLVYGLTNKAMEAYGNLPAEERKYVRAAVRFINPADHISGLLEHAAELELFTDLADKAGDLEDIGDTLEDWWTRLKGKK